MKTYMASKLYALKRTLQQTLPEKATEMHWHCCNNNVPLLNKLDNLICINSPIFHLFASLLDLVV